MAPKFTNLDEMYLQTNNNNSESIEVAYRSKEQKPKHPENEGRISSDQQISTHQFSDTTTPNNLYHEQKPLHKVSIGGPKSSFAPIVRIPSNEIVGNTNNSNFKSYSRGHAIAEKNTKEHSDTVNSSKFSNLLQGWQNRDDFQKKKTYDQTIDYRFRPIIPEDEKNHITSVQQQVEPKQLKKKKIQRIPIVEIFFDDYDSLGTVSSMGYDGSEHDIEAIFNNAYMHPAHYDIREPDEGVREINGTFFSLFLSFFN